MGLLTCAEHGLANMCTCKYKMYLSLPDFLSDRLGSNTYYIWHLESLSFCPVRVPFLSFPGEPPSLVPMVEQRSTLPLYSGGMALEPGWVSTRWPAVRCRLQKNLCQSPNSHRWPGVFALRGPRDSFMLHGGLNWVWCHRWGPDRRGLGEAAPFKMTSGLISWRERHWWGRWWIY